MRRSIRTRLTLSYCTIMILSLSTLGAGVLWLHGRWSLAQFDEELSSIGVASTHAMEEELDEHDTVMKAALDITPTLNLPGHALAILDADGQPLAAHWDAFSYDKTLLRLAAADDISLGTVSTAGRRWRVMTRGHRSPAGRFIVLIASPLDRIEHQQGLLRRVVFVAMPMVALLGTAVAWRVASTALRPLTTMAADVDTITAAGAQGRLPPRPTDDEVGRLTHAFNRLLGRLADSAQAQRQFMADASHEMRTPVSVIHTTAEVTLDRSSRHEAEYREALAIVDEQSTRLGRLVEDMLVLARADAGGWKVRKQSVYLNELVDECVRAAAMMAVPRQIRLLAALGEDVSIVGDDGLLRRLVTNLLTNAIQYSPERDVIRISLVRHERSITLTVADAGPGVPTADRERIFERFVRLESARSPSAGAGLGLSIARWIADQHEGTLTVDDNGDRGCLFSLTLPLPGRES